MNECLATESHEAQAAKVLGITGEHDENTTQIAKQYVKEIWEKRQKQEDEGDATGTGG